MILRFEGGQGNTGAKHPSFFAHKVFQYRDSLAAIAVIESYFLCLRRQGLAKRKDSLCQWMSYPVCVGIPYTFGEPVGARVNPLAFKGIALQHKRITPLVKTCVGTE